MLLELLPEENAPLRRLVPRTGGEMKGGLVEVKKERAPPPTPAGLT